MGKVYICSPLYSEKPEEIRKNMEDAQFLMKAVSQERGCQAVAPHAYLPHLLDDTVPEERSLALKFGISLLQLCQALIICHPRISPGMANEIRWAQELHLPVITRQSNGQYYTPGKIPAPNATNDWREWSRL